jgi:hypothetical protein
MHHDHIATLVHPLEQVAHPTIAHPHLAGSFALTNHPVFSPFQPFQLVTFLLTHLDSFLPSALRLSRGTFYLAQLGTFHLAATRAFLKCSEETLSDKLALGGGVSWIKRPSDAGKAPATKGQAPMKVSKLTFPMLVIVALVSAGRASASAVTFYDIFTNNEYSQTSNTQPSTADGFFGTASLSYTTAGDVGAVQVVNGGSTSPLTLTSSPGNTFNYSASFSTLASMNAAFPLGSPYTFNISGGNLGTASALLNTPADALDSVIPYLTGSSYSQLQGLNPALADTIGINGFSPVAGTTDSYVFLTITRQSDNAVVFQENFLSPSTTSIALAADTLAAGTAYNIDLDYSSRITTPDAGFGTASSLIGFEQRTEIAFTTGSSVPEPSSLTLSLIGATMALAALVFQRRQSKTSV